MLISDQGARGGRGAHRRRKLGPGILLDATSLLVPTGLGLRLGARLAAGSAWLAQRVGRSVVPDLLREYPRRVADLLGEPLADSDGRRLMGERLAYLAARRMMAKALVSRRGQRYLRAEVEAEGVEHLAAAMSQGKGAVLVSTHFGFPNLMRMILRNQGIRHISARIGSAAVNQVSVGGDVWSRIAALRRFKGALGNGGACVVLADGRMGAPLQVQFFGRQTTVTLGAFYLSQAVGCPILPYFGVMPDHRSRLRVEIKPALTPASSADPHALAKVADEFFEVYRDYAQRFPSHLPYRLVRTQRE